MTLPWFLNPWAEVRRLREYLAFWKNDALKWSDLWHAQCCESRRLEAENADLRRRIAEARMEINSWGQRYATQCSINVMVEQENARLKGDPSPLSRKADSRESSDEN